MLTFHLHNSVSVVSWRVRSYAYYTLTFPAFVCALNYIVWGRLSRVGGGLTCAFLLAFNLLSHRVASCMVLPACVPWLPWLPYVAGKLRAYAAKPGAPPAPDSMAAKFTSALDGMEAWMRRTREGVAAQQEALAQSPSWHPVALTAPDGVATTAWLSGWEGGRTRANGLVLYLGGNGEYAETSAASVGGQWAGAGYSVLLLNYRGVSSSGGAATRDGLVLDALTALTFLLAPREQGGLGLPSHRVTVFGHSLGGGIGVEAAALCAYPGFSFCHDRSFGRLTDAAVCLFFPPSLLPEAGAAVGAGRRLNGAPPAPLPPAQEGDSKAYAVRSAFRLFMRLVVGWELDAVSHWPHLPPHTKIVIYAPSDGVIKFPASLAAAVSGAGGAAALPSEQAGCLCKMDFTQDGAMAHNRPLSDSEMGRLKRLLDLAGADLAAGNVLGTGARIVEPRKPLPATW